MRIARTSIAGVTGPLLALMLGAVVLSASACGGAGSEPGSSAPPLLMTRPAEYQQKLIRVVRTVSPSVVQIATSKGLGSGVVFDRKGNIVTNAHVVGTSRTFTITLASGQHRGTLVGTFPAGDLAVVHVEGAKPRPASFADSSKIAVGQVALAIGNPLGLRSSVTDGIVSSLGRTVTEKNGVVLQSAIQTSAAINPGNSGGALVNLAGKVIGVPTLSALDPEFGGAPAPGIGFAIPSNTVRRIAAQLITRGRVASSGRAMLGVSVSSIVGGGVLVAGVNPGGPAEKARIKRGEVIVAVAQTQTPTTEVLVEVLANMKPGQRVPVRLLRPDRTMRRVTVMLGDLARPDPESGGHTLRVGAPTTGNGN